MTLTLAMSSRVSNPIEAPVVPTGVYSSPTKQGTWNTYVLTVVKETGDPILLAISKLSQ